MSPINTFRLKRNSQVGLFTFILRVHPFSFTPSLRSDFYLAVFRQCVGSPQWHLRRLRLWVTPAEAQHVSVEGESRADESLRAGPFNLPHHFSARENCDKLGHPDKSCAGTKWLYANVLIHFFPRAGLTPGCESSFEKCFFYSDDVKTPTRLVCFLCSPHM